MERALEEAGRASKEARRPQMDRHEDGSFPYVLPDIIPFGAAAKKD